MGFTLGKRVAAGLVSLPLAAGAFEGVNGIERDASAKGVSARAAVLEETPVNKEPCLKSAFVPLDRDPLSARYGYFRKNGKRSKRIWIGWGFPRPRVEQLDSKGDPDATIDPTCPGTVTLTFQARMRTLVKSRKGTVKVLKKWLPNSKVYKHIEQLRPPRTYPSPYDPSETYFAYGDDYVGKQRIPTFKTFNKKAKPEVVIKKTYTAFGESKSKTYRVDNWGLIRYDSSGRRIKGIR